MLFQDGGRVCEGDRLLKSIAGVAFCRSRPRRAHPLCALVLRAPHTHTLSARRCARDRLTRCGGAYTEQRAQLVGGAVGRVRRKAERPNATSQQRDSATPHAEAFRPPTGCGAARWYERL
jgi:hypothetical protein